MNANSVFSSIRSTSTYNLITSHSLDILGLTETRVLQDSAALTHCTPPSHQVLHNARPSTSRSSRGGGVAIIAAKRLDCKRYKYVEKVTTFEFIIIQFQGIDRPCLVANVYRPPSSSVTTFMNEFSNFIETLNIPNRDLVIMGDFNIHVDDPDDSNGTQFCNLLNDLSMQNHVKVPTYKRSNHTLDLVIDSYTHSYLEPIVSDVKVCLTSSFSDHGFVSYSINCRPFFVKVDTTIQFRKYNDVEIFRDETRNLLDTLETTESLELTTLFNQALTTKRDEFFPLLSKTITLCAASPWYNGSCKRSKTSCRRFERRYRKRPSVTSRESYLLPGCGRC